MTVTFANTIPVERLAAGVVIDVPGFGPAEVYAVRFDGSGYAVDFARSARGGWDDLDSLYVEAGGSVDHAGIGEPRFVRPEDEVTREEWDAKAEAGAPVNLLDAVNHAKALAQLDRATDAFCLMLATRSIPALREAGEQQRERV